MVMKTIPEVNENLRKCVFSKDVYVACADILGFKDIMKRGKISETVHALSVLLGNEVAAGQLDWATGKTVAPGGNVDDGTRLGAYVGYSVFSDTVLLWSLDKTNKSFLALLRACGLVIASGLSNAHMLLPFRVGVALGEVHIDPSAGIYVGMGIVKAFLTEQCQDWLGGALCPDISREAIEPMLTNRLTPVVQYEIPQHTGTVEALQEFIGDNDAAICWALNWTHHIGSANHVSSELESLSAEANAANAGKYTIAREFYLKHRINRMDSVE